MQIVDYKAVFISIEDCLRNYYKLSIKEFQLKFADFTSLKYQARSDQFYFDHIKMIVFYSGFNADTVTKKLPIIKKHFPDFSTVAKYDETNVSEILTDKDMIRNRLKVEAVVKNAKRFVKLIEKHGSFYKYLESFAPQASFLNLMLLKEELECQFEYLGEITGYHFLMEIGLDVMKPDRVISRIFKRLGLIESDKQLLKTIFLGREFAKATGYPIRYIDIVFVTYGQQGDRTKSMDGICLENKPKCQFCGVKIFCNYDYST